MKINGLKRYLHLPIKIALASLILCLSIFIAYQYQPVSKLVFGRGLDRVYLSNAHPLQTKMEGKSFRRIRGVTYLSLPFTGHGLHYNFTIRALSSEPKNSPQRFVIYINKKKCAEADISNEPSEIKFAFTEGKLKGPYLLFQLVNEGEKSRQPRAVFLESMVIEPLKTGNFVLPPADLMFYLLSTMIFIFLGTVICNKKAPVWSSSVFIIIVTLSLLFARWLFLPFVPALPIIALASFFFIIAVRLLYPLALKKMKLNPALFYFELLLLIVFAGFIVRTVVCLYPGTIISDIDFHAHRMGAVYKSGDIFQTSTTPDEKYSFPYPTLLYLLLIPIKMVSSLPNAVILKWGIAFIDSIVPLLIFLYAMKMMKNEKAGLIASAIYCMFPLTWLKFIHGNCTDIFSILTIWLFLIVFSVGYKDFHKKRLMILPIISLILALLSHFGATLFLLLFLPIMVFTLYVAFSNPKNNKRVITAAITAAAALIIVFLAFYLRYIPMIKGQAVKILHSSSTSEWRSENALLHRFVQSSSLFFEYIGIPLFIVFVFCFAAYAEKRRRTPGFLFITGLFITAVAFAILSVFTPLSIRWLLPALPAVSLVIGWGLEKTMKIRGLKWAAYLILALCLVFSLHTIYSAMFNGPYHQLF